MKNSRRKNYKMKIRAILLTALAILICLLAFVGCDEEESTLYADNGLEYVVNSDGVTCTIVGIGRCTDTVITVPESIRDYWVTAIGKEAFCPGNYEICADITEMILPEGLEMIGELAFNDCTSLEKINLPNTITEMGLGAFWGCTSLDNVTLPTGISVISSQLFYKCTSLKEITIPENVKIIEEGAFTVSGIVTVRIEAKLEKIGSLAFFYCEELKDLYFNGTFAEAQAVGQGEGWIAGYVTIHCTDRDCTPDDI